MKASSTPHSKWYFVWYKILYFCALDFQARISRKNFYKAVWIWIFREIKHFGSSSYNDFHVKENLKFCLNFHKNFVKWQITSYNILKIIALNVWLG